ncbi:hypothetical protein [Paenibacillus xylanilyticus]|uniref:Uncharacterized protein n=1 Tax=Paenibacillus xylanilyticus TaxID=248903 RepID=A0A7Y6C379_9BACL|nr:hypothetical protein [Paenibacillus xylanilyticus]NUU79797.1 hypothetical protein [Paenibacillus xylanilyticus]
MMKSIQEKHSKVYVRTNSYDLWWGVYGLSHLTGWEDIRIYSDANGENRIGFVCICTKNYLEHGLEDMESDPEELHFVNSIRTYLADDQIHFHYYYDNPSDEDFYELPYTDLPTNELGVKPRGLEMWHPNRGIDIGVIEECVTLFCRKFLDMEVGEIHFKEPIDLNEAVQSYTKHMETFNGNIAFSDDLVKNMMGQLSKSEEEVMNILNRSVGK